jgi:hypothetical protein
MGLAECRVLNAGCLKQSPESLEPDAWFSYPADKNNQFPLPRGAH